MKKRRNRTKCCTDHKRENCIRNSTHYKDLCLYRSKTKENVNKMENSSGKQKLTDSVDNNKDIESSGSDSETFVKSQFDKTAALPDEKSDSGNEKDGVDETVLNGGTKASQNQNRKEFECVSVKDRKTSENDEYHSLRRDLSTKQADKRKKMDSKNYRLQDLEREASKTLASHTVEVTRKQVDVCEILLTEAEMTDSKRGPLTLTESSVRTFDDSSLQFLSSLNGMSEAFDKIQQNDLKKKAIDEMNNKLQFVSSLMDRGEVFDKAEENDLDKVFDNVDNKYRVPGDNSSVTVIDTHDKRDVRLLIYIDNLGKKRVCSKDNNTDYPRLRRQVVQNRHQKRASDSKPDLIDDVKVFVSDSNDSNVKLETESVGVGECFKVNSDCVTPRRSGLGILTGCDVTEAIEVQVVGQRRLCGGATVAGHFQQDRVWSKGKHGLHTGRGVFYQKEDVIRTNPRFGLKKLTAVTRIGKMRRKRSRSPRNNGRCAKTAFGRQRHRPTGRKHQLSDIRMWQPGSKYRCCGGSKGQTKSQQRSSVTRTGNRRDGKRHSRQQGSLSGGGDSTAGEGEDDDEDSRKQRPSLSGMMPGHYLEGVQDDDKSSHLSLLDHSEEKKRSGYSNIDALAIEKGSVQINRRVSSEEDMGSNPQAGMRRFSPSMLCTKTVHSDEELHSIERDTRRMISQKKGSEEMQGQADPYSNQFSLVFAYNKKPNGKNNDSGIGDSGQNGSDLGPGSGGVASELPGRQSGGSTSRGSLVRHSSSDSGVLMMNLELPRSVSGGSRSSDRPYSDWESPVQSPEQISSSSKKNVCFSNTVDMDADVNNSPEATVASNMGADVKTPKLSSVRTNIGSEVKDYEPESTSAFKMTGGFTETIDKLGYVTRTADHVRGQLPGKRNLDLLQGIPGQQVSRTEGQTNEKRHMEESLGSSSKSVLDLIAKPKTEQHVSHSKALVIKDRCSDVSSETDRTVQPETYSEGISEEDVVIVEGIKQLQIGSSRQVDNNNKDTQQSPLGTGVSRQVKDRNKKTIRSDATPEILVTGVNRQVENRDKQAIKHLATPEVLTTGVRRQVENRDKEAIRSDTTPEVLATCVSRQVDTKNKEMRQSDAVSKVLTTSVSRQVEDRAKETIPSDATPEILATNGIRSQQEKRKKDAHQVGLPLVIEEEEEIGGEGHETSSSLSSSKSPPAANEEDYRGKSSEREEICERQAGSQLPSAPPDNKYMSESSGTGEGSIQASSWIPSTPIDAKYTGESSETEEVLDQQASRRLPSPPTDANDMSKSSGTGEGCETSSGDGGKAGDSVIDRVQESDESHPGRHRDVKSKDGGQRSEEHIVDPVQGASGGDGETSHQTSTSKEAHVDLHPVSAVKPKAEGDIPDGQDGQVTALEDDVETLREEARVTQLLTGRQTDQFRMLMKDMCDALFGLCMGLNPRSSSSSSLFRVLVHLLKHFVGCRDSDPSSQTCDKCMTVLNIWKDHHDYLAKGSLQGGSRFLEPRCQIEICQKYHKRKQSAVRHRENKSCFSMGAASSFVSLNCSTKINVQKLRLFFLKQLRDNGHLSLADAQQLQRSVLERERILGADDKKPVTTTDAVTQIPRGAVFAGRNTAVHPRLQTLRRSMGASLGTDSELRLGSIPARMPSVSSLQSLLGEETENEEEMDHFNSVQAAGSQPLGEENEEGHVGLHADGTVELPQTSLMLDIVKDEPDHAMAVQENRGDVPGFRVVYGTVQELIFKAEVWMDIREMYEDQRILPADSTNAEGFILDAYRQELVLDEERGLYEKDLHYDEVTFVGSGVSGKCYLAMDKATRRKFCIKIVDLLHFDSEEMIIWAELNHPNVVKLYGVLRKQRDILFLSEFIEGTTLKDAILQQKGLNTHIALSYMRDILQALCHLQDMNVLHEDLKADNIMLRNCGNINSCVVIDFGVSTKLEFTPYMENVHPRGAATHWSPEKARSDRYSYSADVWAAFCNLIHMLAGVEPWVRRYEVRERLLLVIADTDSGPLDDLPMNTDERVRAFINFGMNVNSDQRPSARELLNHQIFTMIESLCTSTTCVVGMESEDVFIGEPGFNSFESQTMPSLTPDQTRRLAAVNLPTVVEGYRQSYADENSYQEQLIEEPQAEVQPPLPVVVDEMSENTEQYPTVLHSIESNAVDKARLDRNGSRSGARFLAGCIDHTQSVSVTSGAGEAMISTSVQNPPGVDYIPALPGNGDAIPDGLFDSLSVYTEGQVSESVDEEFERYTSILFNQQRSKSYEATLFGEQSNKDETKPVEGEQFVAVEEFMRKEKEYDDFQIIPDLSTFDDTSSRMSLSESNLEQEELPNIDETAGPSVQNRSSKPDGTGFDRPGSRKNRSHPGSLSSVVEEQVAEPQGAAAALPVPPRPLQEAVSNIDNYGLTNQRYWFRGMPYSRTVPNDMDQVAQEQVQILRSLSQSPYSYGHPPPDSEYPPVTHQPSHQHLEQQMGARRMPVNPKGSNLSSTGVADRPSSGSSSRGLVQGRKVPQTLDWGHEYDRSVATSDNSVTPGQRPTRRTQQPQHITSPDNTPRVTQPRVDNEEFGTMGFLPDRNNRMRNRQLSERDAFEQEQQEQNRQLQLLPQPRDCNDAPGTTDYKPMAFLQDRNHGRSTNQLVLEKIAFEQEQQRESIVPYTELGINPEIFPQDIYSGPSESSAQPNQSPIMTPGSRNPLTSTPMRGGPVSPSSSSKSVHKSKSLLLFDSPSPSSTPPSRNPCDRRTSSPFLTGTSRNNAMDHFSFQTAPSNCTPPPHDNVAPRSRRIEDSPPGDQYRERSGSTAESLYSSWQAQELSRRISECEGQEESRLFQHISVNSQPEEVMARLGLSLSGSYHTANDAQSRHASFNQEGFLLNTSMSSSNSQSGVKVEFCSSELHVLQVFRLKSNEGDVTWEQAVTRVSHMLHVKCDIEEFTVHSDSFNLPLDLNETIPTTRPLIQVIVQPLRPNEHFLWKVVDHCIVYSEHYSPQFPQTYTNQQA